MKIFKKIIMWIIISLVFQVGVLIYLDKFYFNSDSIIKQTKVPVSSSTPTPEPVIIKLDENQNNLKLSYSGKYASYLDQNSLKIIDTTNGKVQNCDITQNSRLSYYKWLPDRNTIIIAEKAFGSKGTSIKFYKYDVSKGNKEEIRDNISNKSVSISVFDSNAEVSDTALSTITNVLYVKVSLSGKKSTIYRLDIMADVSKPKFSGFTVGRIMVAPTVDDLIYEDLTYKKIRTESGTTLKINNVSTYELLGVDSENNVYVGSVKNGKVVKIYYGALKESTDKWENIDLKEPVSQDSIYVSLDGKIYINNNLNGTVTEIISDKETKYNGVFKEMYSTGIASVISGKLNKTAFK